MERETTFEFEPVDVLEFDTIEALDALVSSFRLRLLSCFREPSTIKRAAEELDVKPTRLYHHVHRLVEHGFLAVVAEIPKGKTVEKVYSKSYLSTRPSADFYRKYGVEGNAELVKLGFRTAESEVVDAALSDPTLDTSGDRAVLGFTRLNLSEDELRNLVKAVDALFHQYRSRSGDIEVSFMSSVIPLDGGSSRKK